MKPIAARPHRQPTALEGLRAESLENHYRLYLGYVEKYNQLAQRLGQLQQAASESGEGAGVRVDLTYALAAIRNHELYFDILGRSEAADGAVPPRLAEALKRDFGSTEKFLTDLRTSAIAAAGWAWTTVDLEHGTIFNYGGTRLHALPVWDVQPIIAVDLYVHAYAYDFGQNRAAYIDVVLRNLNWRGIARRFEAAQKRCTPRG